MKEDGEKGTVHLFQAIILYFTKKYPEQKKLAGTFCKVLYDRKVFSDEFLNSWHEGNIKLDKNTKLYDRKADKAFKAEVAPFIEWLQYGEEDDGEEEENEEAEEQQEEQKETEAQKNQRLMIEAKKKELQEKMEAARLASQNTEAESE